MCGYCKFRYINEDIGEKSNEVQHMAMIREGHHILELGLNRYHDGGDYHNNELILANSVNLDGSIHTVSEKHIKIKYCPFCGEEL